MEKKLGTPKALIGAKIERYWIGDQTLLISGISLAKSVGVVHAKQKESTVSSKKVTTSQEPGPYLAKTLTDEDVLEANKETDMKAKMELMIMRVQKEFVDKLQLQELDAYKFQV